MNHAQRRHAARRSGSDDICRGWTSSRWARNPLFRRSVSRRTARQCRIAELRHARPVILYVDRLKKGSQRRAQRIRERDGNRDCHCVWAQAMPSRSAYSRYIDYSLEQRGSAEQYPGFTTEPCLHCRSAAFHCWCGCTRSGTNPSPCRKRHSQSEETEYMLKTPRLCCKCCISHLNVGRCRDLLQGRTHEKSKD